MATALALGALMTALLWAGWARAAPAPARSAPTPPAVAPAAPPGLDTPGGARAAMAEGRWARGCALATDALAEGRPDREALGLFGVCAAVRNDRTTAGAALATLYEIERKPAYAALVQGVLALQEPSVATALPLLEAALAARPGDPLVLYFLGEAQRAAGQGAQALAAFMAALKPWPNFTPALAGAAQLLSTPAAAQAQLVTARGLLERATAVEPMNVGHWKLLAAVCRRTGQAARAEAITQQWLRPAAMAADANAARAANPAATR